MSSKVPMAEAGIPPLPWCDLDQLTGSRRPRLPGLSEAVGLRPQSSSLGSQANPITAYVLPAAPFPQINGNGAIVSGAKNKILPAGSRDQPSYHHLICKDQTQEKS